MRTIVPLLLFVPATCFALGAEDTGFYGFLDNGKLVELKVKDDPQVWSNRNFVYGTPQPGALFLCWGTKVNEIPSKFSCTQVKGGKPTTVYDALPIPGHGAHPPKGAPYADEYKKIAQQAKLGSGVKQGDGVVLSIYKCSAGCTSRTPAHLYEVGKFD